YVAGDWRRRIARGLRPVALQFVRCLNVWASLPPVRAKFFLALVPAVVWDSWGSLVYAPASLRPRLPGPVTGLPIATHRLPPECRAGSALFGVARRRCASTNPSQYCVGVSR